MNNVRCKHVKMDPCAMLINESDIDSGNCTLISSRTVALMADVRHDNLMSAIHDLNVTYNNNQIDCPANSAGNLRDDVMGIMKGDVIDEFSRQSRGIVRSSYVDEINRSSNKLKLKELK